MSDMGETFGTLRDARDARRKKFGVACPRCIEKRPKAQPSILLPNQTCKVDGYIDPRPHTTREQRNECYREAGIDLIELDG
jgi:hypothetical protein